MQIGMMGLGRMGANMVRRLMRDGHECVVYDINSASVAALVKDGAIGAAALEEFVAKLAKPRCAWLMLPAAITGRIVDQVAALMEPGDIIIDGGNSYYHDAVDQAAKLAVKGISFVDVGTSGGVWGLERGYCLMIGGPDEAVQHLDTVFATLAPGADPGSNPPKDAGSATFGYLHCGPSGAGHFVKMVHNGIEYGVMAAYAEGINILKSANAGKRDRTADAETSPLENPQYYQFDIDLAQVAEVWRHGSVIGSWLLDLTAGALKSDPTLTQFGGRVSDSGEGRWTLKAAIDTGVPAPVLSSALFDRFSSQGESAFADKLLSAMRYAFGGHIEKQKTGA
ncbi:decarboxylating 6-phosphogluconate dehydrogenase [Mesorhizobium sp. M1C.F.Ca.ET.193.01.1.1]|uniref:phosphogluconate dehydrogenase (NAD(+)-dependent, decarboxylating) n=1 Tax=unclassified Mesorhizobium TaxID=325217 RepID=UPI000FD229B9|nr:MULTISPECIES: decarboxylating 6-phosphogluconate dehydrogenase [unclassified Mesorhizobium]TGS92514.1 decarboxylating 6-phosphogluconate dehydrogenase [bacterium M00.F.Ca.ET.177.01.1.1]TGQ50227.1 decarboxylating 6-phosphogluconate dehydrogenase [Mesorhizobium sp. M1C.F.Ca.ET.210.01.1.1]TGQ64914.1 decarboxylating 6-phosphogluconate dehydrogenase [Mesorhizobium sp. M1C.F.Ca.ET.212.01.1.1]TGQ98697.1 decarboxylating 6-phosphogluconate dehydrogenase [Mesorhizobium sp. M1C.F.Ca.ET.204.01.1.1]TGR1